MKASAFLLFFIFLIGCSSDDSTPPTSPYVPPTTPDPIEKTSVINDLFLGAPIVVYGNSSKQLMVSFSRTLTGGETIEAEELEIASNGHLFQDTKGNIYDAFGKVVSGPNLGEELRKINSLNTYWFSISATFPGTGIYDGESINASANQINNSSWTIPTNFVFEGSSLDFIPSIDNPQFEVFQPRDLIESYPHLQEEGMVTVIQNGDSYKVYPHSILSYHEIVNDELEDGSPITMLYCPLIGSSVVWKGSEATTFGVSGLLYNSDLIAFDRVNNSRWLQLTGECVNGQQLGQKKEKVKHFDIEWGSLGSIFPDTNVSVLSADTVQDYDYSVFPYNGYRDNDDFIFFPVTFSDDRIPNKEVVHALLDDGLSAAKVYRLSSFK